jgi:hypothetical protein
LRNRFSAACRSNGLNMKSVLMSLMFSYVTETSENGKKEKGHGQ